jgi:hypothetical protein
MSMNVQICFKLGKNYRNFHTKGNFSRAVLERRDLKPSPRLAARDAAFTGTLGGVPPCGGSQPRLPVNAASQPRVSDFMPYCLNSALGTSPARI